MGGLCVSVFECVYPKLQHVQDGKLDQFLGGV